VRVNHVWALALSLFVSGASLFVSPVRAVPVGPGDHFSGFEPDNGKRTNVLSTRSGRPGGNQSAPIGPSGSLCAPTYSPPSTTRRVGPAVAARRATRETAINGNVANGRPAIITRETRSRILRGGAQPTAVTPPVVPCVDSNPDIETGSEAFAPPIDPASVEQILDGITNPLGSDGNQLIDLPEFTYPDPSLLIEANLDVFDPVDNVSPRQVPEPATLALFSAGLAGLVVGPSPS
jgi:hypothetical protein